MIGSELERSVGQLVRQCPSRSRVFERLSIDYCCGGKISLEDACHVRGLDAEEVWKELADCQDSREFDDPIVDADAMSLTELADHIESTHHAYLKTELPRLDQMTKKVAGVHGDKEPRLRQLREAFVAFRDEVTPHLAKEEQVLFPMVRQLESQGEARSGHRPELDSPITELEHEHDNAGAALAKMRAVTDDFVPPDWACNTYRAMLDGLADLEQDMHQHVHKENNVLFPKSMQLESCRVEG